MKSTGVTRKIDELGRIVIPKEIRRNLGIRDGENLEIFIENNGILLKKYSHIKSYEEIGKKLCTIIGSIIDANIIITDREKVVASTLNEDIVNKELSKELIYLIDNRESLNSEESKKIVINDYELSGYFNISPIISSIDSLGLVLIHSNEKRNYQDISKLIAKILAEKIDIY